MGKSQALAALQHSTLITSRARSCVSTWRTLPSSVNTARPSCRPSSCLTTCIMSARWLKSSTASSASSIYIGQFTVPPIATTSCHHQTYTDTNLMISLSVWQVAAVLTETACFTVVWRRIYCCCWLRPAGANTGRVHCPRDVAYMSLLLPLNGSLDPRESIPQTCSSAAIAALAVQGSWSSWPAHRPHYSICYSL